MSPGSQNAHLAHILPSMSTLILRLVERKVPLLERSICFSLKQNRYPSEVVPSIPSLWPRQVPLPPGPILFLAEYAAHCAKDANCTRLPKFTCQTLCPAPLRSKAARKPSGLAVLALPYARFKPCGRICARKGYCSFPASFPRCRCQSRPADR